MDDTPTLVFFSKFCSIERYFYAGYHIPVYRTPDVLSQLPILKCSPMRRTSTSPLFTPAVLDLQSV